MRKNKLKQPRWTLKFLIKRYGMLIAPLCIWAYVMLAILMSAPTINAAEPPVTGTFIEQYGRAYGLSTDGRGGIFYKKEGVREALAFQPKMLNGAVLDRLHLLTAKIAEQNPDEALVPVLQTLLRPTLGEVNRLNGKLLYVKKDGVLQLTQFGRNMLMDLLTAQDGVNFQGPVPASQDGLPKVRRESVLERLKKEGQLLHLAEQARSAGGEVFDAGNAAPQQLVYPMEAYGKWRKLEKGKAGDVYIDPETGNMRLIVSAKNAVVSDRFKVLDGEENGIYEETGLDEKLIAAHGGKIVRAIDNLVEVDISKEQAAELGRALEERGVHSQPNLAVAMANAGREIAKQRFPFAGLLPFGKNLLKRLTGGEYRIQSDVAKNLLQVDKMWEKGMEGEGTVVGIIDTGLDTKHPDFKDRVLTYVDLVQGGVDAVGHGTHCAGAVGGDGKASGGKYKGMAPKTKFVIIQVFNSWGMGASEMSLLAAMKIASSLPKNIRPDVLSMSLGIAGPGGHNLHSTSLLSNYMMLRNKVFLSIAAGNSGPEKYTVGAPGNAKHALTVTGTDKHKEIPFFPSRGPITNWPFKEYNKPDLATIAGGVTRGNKCPYAPEGLIAAKSGDEKFPQSGGDACDAPGNPYYRYMSGTSMATPLASGIAADVIGYLKANGIPYTASEVKALLMETADDLGRPAYEQGAGFVNGERLAKALEERVKAGAVAGNVALMVARDLTGFQKWYLEKHKSIVMTQAGLLDTRTNHLVHNDAEVDALRQTVKDEYASKPLLERIKIRLAFARRSK
ncbi:MAG: S8 family serine peptidase [Elusimicrobiota bacterium]